ncbi:MAG: HAD-IA family hydrolase, partial [Geminicoccaceae bacterium]|nr:HAD-IA family hydrolase [Geminicoccaceae bacterium]
ARTLHLLESAGVLLAVATGKSRRGLEQVLGHHGLDHLFVSLQTADDNPSKPHPAMLERAIGETGSRPEETAFVGDTTFDMMMARAVGARGLGVAHGYHAREDLLAHGAERNEMLAVAQRELQVLVRVQVGPEFGRRLD